MVTTLDIIEAYIDCRKNKRRKHSAVEFELNFEENCAKLAQEINNRTYKIGKSIAFFVTRPKKREVFAADFRDRIVHHWLMLRLESEFEKLFIHDTYNCRKLKGTQYGIELLYNKLKTISENYTKDCWIAKFDIKGFFMSIHKPTLWAMLKKFITERYTDPKDKDDVLWAAHQIVANRPELNCVRKSPLHMWDGFPENKSLFTCGDDKGLPIGNLTSLIFANFYLDKFDKKMVATFWDGYGRYVDDFFVISTNKLLILRCIGKISEWLKINLGVILHPDKIYLLYYAKGVKFTGGVVKPNRIYTANRTVDKYKLLIQFVNNNPTVYSTEEVVCRINSYLGFLKHTASYTIKRRLTSTLSDYWLSKLTIAAVFNKVTANKCEKKRIYIINLIKTKSELW